MCGKQIPSGTLCDDCYREAMEDSYKPNKSRKNESSRQGSGSNNLLIKINRKFLPKYQFFVDWELFLFSLLIVGYAILLQRVSLVLGSIAFSLLLYAFSFFISKRIAVGTKCMFYENQVVYTFDFLFIHKKSTYKYSEIQDIIYNQKFIQKKFGLGDISIISNKKGPFVRGFDVQNVANVTEVFEKLTSLVGKKLV